MNEYLAEVINYLAEANEQMGANRIVGEDEAAWRRHHRTLQYNSYGVLIN